MNRRHAFAAASLGTAAVFFATACGSSDSGSSASSSDAKAPVAGSTAPASPSADPANTSGSGAGPANASGSGAGSANAPAPDATSPGSASAPAAPAAAAKSAPIHTQTLVDGSKAAIYRLGDEHYLAKVTHDGQLFTTLETHDQDAGLDANDMFLVLSLDGTLHSWMGGDHQGPGTFKLAGDWTAKVTKVGELRYRAQILGNEGEVDATLETNQHDVGLDANGVYIVLSDGGVISAHE